MGAMPKGIQDRFGRNCMRNPRHFGSNLGRISKKSPKGKHPRKIERNSIIKPWELFWEIAWTKFRKKFLEN